MLEIKYPDGCSYHPACLDCNLYVCRYDVRSLATAKRLTRLMAERRQASLKMAAHRSIPVDEVLASVADEYGVLVEEITGPSRRPHIYAARREAAIRLRRFPSLTLAAIGMHLGGRDHATILHALRRDDPNWHHNKKRLAAKTQ